MELIIISLYKGKYYTLYDVKSFI